LGGVVGEVRRWADGVWLTAAFEVGRMGAGSRDGDGSSA
jgi:hypothetical protein